MAYDFLQSFRHCWHAACTNEDTNNETELMKPQEAMMGWTISVSSKGMKCRTNTGKMTPSAVRHTGGQWSLTPTADSGIPDQAGSNPAWQTRRVWRKVLSTLVGFD
jgi:hypothetical protein